MKPVTKKLMAFVLMFALVFTSLTPVQAAKKVKAPQIGAKTVSVAAGTTKTLSVKNKIAKSTYRWSSSNKKIVAVTQKGVVKGVKAGKAVITCKVKTPKKNYTLKCKVTVTTTDTVSTAKQLKAALANKKLKKIVLKSEAEKTITIPKGNYTTKTLVVDMPNGSVVNNGTFKSITIKAIKPHTWTERANGNKIIVVADLANIVVDKNCTVREVAFDKEGATITLKVNGAISVVSVANDQTVNIQADGSIKGIEITKPAKVTVTGTADSVPITVTETAKGAEIKSDVPVNVTSETDVKLTLETSAERSKVEVTKPANVEVTGTAKSADVKVAETATGSSIKSDVTVNVTTDTNVKVELAKGAENSKVETTVKGVSIEVDNQTTEKVVVTTPEGTSSVNGDQSQTTTDTKPSENTSSGTTSGGSGGSGGSYNPPVQTPTEDPAVTALKNVAKEALQYTYTTEENGNQNYLPLDSLTMDGNKITATFTFDNAKDYIKSVYDFKKSQNAIADGKIKDKDAIDYVIDSCVMNTFARYMGAVYHKSEKSTATTVAAIRFGETEYKWNADKNLVASNWYNGDTSLVSAVVNAQDNKAIRDVTVTLVDDKGKTADITFVANVNVDREAIANYLNPELVKLVTSAKGYDYGEQGKTTYLAFDNLTVSGTAVTADFSKDEVKTEIQKIYNDLTIDESGNVTVNENAKEARAYAIDKYVMNTFARYVGALYRCENQETHTIAKIRFDGADYTWNSSKNLVGSNWYSGDTSLVSAVVAQQNSAIRDVTLELVDTNGMAITVTFNVTNVPDVNTIQTKTSPETTQAPETTPSTESTTQPEATTE